MMQGGKVRRPVGPDAGRGLKWTRSQTVGVNEFLLKFRVREGIEASFTSRQYGIPIVASAELRVVGGSMWHAIRELTRRHLADFSYMYY